MKYSRILMTALLSVMLFCVACTENDKFKQDAVTPVLPMEDTKVDPLGDEWMVSYTTNASSWTISKEAEAGDTDWVICDTQSGKAGTTKVKITVLPNTTSSERKLTVKFGGDSQFKIYQNAALLEVGLKQEEKHPWLHPEKSFDVKSTLFWRIEGIDEETKNWLKGIESGVIYEKDKNLSLNFTTNNYSDTNNVATIRFVPVKKNYLGEEVPVEQQSEALRNAVDELTYEVIIIQEHIKFLVNYGEGKTDLERFSEFGENMNPDDGQSYVNEPYSQTVTVESETEWVIDELNKPEWISVDPGESSAPDDRGIMYRDLKISVPGLNVDKENEREGKVILKSKDDENAFREIYVTQNSFQLSIKMTEDKDGKNEIDTFAVSPEDTAYLHVETRGPWKIKEDDLPDWLTVDPELMSGVGSPDPIPVSSDVWNLEFEKQDYDVTCTAEIQDKSYPSVTVTPSVKTVYKDPFVFKVGENLIDGQPAKEVLAAIPRLSTEHYNLQVNCSGPWTMTLEGEGKEEEEEWLYVSVYSAEGNHTMRVGAESANPNANQPRSKYLKFTSSVHTQHNKQCDSILTVTQEKYIFNMFKDGTKDEAPEYDNVPAYKKDGIIYKVKLQCADSWSLRCDSGVSVTNESGQPFTEKEREGKNFPILYVHVETNLSKGSPKGSPKLKNIYVTSAFDGEEKAIRITQDAFVFDVNTKNIPTDNILYNSQDTYTVDVKSTAEAEWEVRKLDDNSNWVSYTGNEADLKFKVSQNGNTGSLREAKFAVYNKISEESVPVTFKQEAYVWNVTASDPSPFNEINANNSAYSFKVKCSDAWKITGVPDWLSVSPTGDDAGLDEKTVTIEPVSDNLSLEKDREATLKIDGTFADVEHKQEIKVTQQRYVFDVAANTKQFDYDGGTATLDVKSSGKWTVSTDKDFVTVPSGDQPASRDNAQKCDIQVQPNYDAGTRTATLTFQTEHYDSDNAPHLRKTIKISQAAYEFEVNEKTSDFALVDIPAEGAVSAEISVKCSGSWDCKVENDKEWLTVEKTEDGFTYTVAKNTKKDSRSATITVNAFKLDGKNIARKIIITIKQKGK